MTVRNNQNGSALLLIMVVGILIVFAAMSTFTSSTFTMAKTSQRKLAVSAFNIAEAGKEHAIAALNADLNLAVPFSRDSILKNIAMGDGTPGSYTVLCSTNALKDSIWITSVGSIFDNSTEIDVICIPGMVAKQINPTINAAITTRSSFSSNGAIVIDGRNWDHISHTIVDGGISGVRYNGVLDQTGNSRIGGNGNEPIKNAFPPIVDPNGSGNPTTPEEVLGLDPGDLDDYIIDTIPSGPLNFENKILYISPPAGDEIWINPDFGGSTGILIFHNEGRTAQLKNIHGDFKGIIIADQIVHINANALIYGAIFTLSPVEGGNTFGNGNSDIRYSQSLIELLIQFIEVGKGEGLQEVSWKQK
ncbi:MAG: hypothetical protein PVI26_05540 [Chitinispirillia bacterium]|jgi:hypothetical protein